MRPGFVVLLLLATCSDDQPGVKPGDSTSAPGDARGDPEAPRGDERRQGDATVSGDESPAGDPVLSGDQRLPGDARTAGDDTPPVDPPFWEEDFTGQTIATLTDGDWTVVELSPPTAGARWEIGADNPDDILDYNLDGDFLFADTAAFSIPTESMHARIATPLIALDPDPILELDYYDTALGDTTDVVISTDGDAWTSTSSMGCNLVESFVRETFSCDLGAYASTSIYIGFVYQGDGGGAWHIDNVRLR